MKKLFTIFIAMLFGVSFSFAVVGCKKAEEKEASTTEALTEAAKETKEAATDAANEVKETTIDAAKEVKEDTK